MSTSRRIGKLLRMVSATRTTGVAWLMLCAGAAVPMSVRAQSTSNSGTEDGFGAWTLVGVDVGIQNRWRSTVRLGYLGDVDSRVLLTDLTFVSGRVWNVVIGYVYVQPTATALPGTTLARGGVTWVPVRRRVTIDNRFLVERLSNSARGTSVRGRSRLRISSSLPWPEMSSAFASLEAIGAAHVGFVENRMQMGVTKSVGRWSMETYWLQRRIRDRPTINGLGFTAYCRLGT